MNDYDIKILKTTSLTLTYMKKSKKQKTAIKK